MKSLWDYAVEVYALPGVKDGLLKLQDRFHFDVNQVLWCLWCGRFGLTLNDSQVAEVLSTTADFAAHTTRPLRSVRLFLDGPRAGFRQDDLKAMRDQVLELEIHTEKLVLHRLDRATQDITSPRDELDDTAGRSEQLFTLVSSGVDTPIMIAEESGPESPLGLFQSLRQTVEDLGP